MTSINLDPLNDAQLRRRLYTVTLLSFLLPPSLGCTIMGFVGFYPMPQVYLILFSYTGLYVLLMLFIGLALVPHSHRFIVSLAHLDRNQATEKAQRVFARLPWILLGVITLYSIGGAITADISLESMGIRHFNLRDHLYNQFGLIPVVLISAFPIFFYFVDSLGRYLGPRGVSVTAIPLWIKLLMLGIVTPLLIDSLLIGYYINRTGFFHTETFVLWFSLLLLAIGGTWLAWRSLQQGMAPLEAFIDSRAGTMSDRARAKLTPLSLDEHGVLTARYADLLTNQQQLAGDLESSQAFTQSLLRLAHKLQRTTSYYDVLGVIRQEISELLGYRDTWLFLLSEDNQYAEMIAYQGEIVETMTDHHPFMRLELRSDAFLRELSLSDKPVIIEDMRTDSRADPGRQKLLDNRTTINVPMILDNQRIGFFSTGTFGEEGVRVPTPAETEYLQAIATYTSVTIVRIKATLALQLLQQELLRSEARLSHAQSIAQLGSWELDLATQVLSWSKQTYKIFGLPNSNRAITYQDFLAAVHPDDRQQLDRVYHDSIRDHTHYETSHRIVLADGTIKWVQEHGETIYAQDGTALRTIGAVQDITQRIDAQESLRTSNQLLGTLLDTTPVLIAYLDPDMNFVRVNQAYAAADGKKPDDFIGQNHFTLFPNAENEAIFRRVATTGETYSTKARAFEYEHHPERGVSHWDWTLAPLKDDAGQVTGLVLSLLNVTDRIQALEAVQRNEITLQELNAQLKQNVDARTAELLDAHQFNEQILAASVFGIVVYDNSGQCVYANTSVENILGGNREQVLKQNFRQIQTWQQSGMLAAAEQVLANGTPLSAEYHLQTTWGKEVWLACHFSRFIRAGKSNLLLLVNNISRRKQAELALLNAKEEAERANKTKNDFLARMSHELRTPMNAILGFSQILTMEPLQPEQHDFVQEIDRAGSHLLQLINELLDLSRIESGKMHTVIQPVNLQQLSIEAAKFIQPIIAERRLTLRNSCDPHITVLSDPTRLKQVLINLLSNAAKYNNDMGRITIDCRALNDSRVRLAITDTGPGIAPEKLTLLFTPFERLGAENTAVEGAGIGLALSRQLAKLMDAELGVDSSPGQGTTFWLDLPHKPDINVPTITTATVSETTNVDAYKILYVEDNPANLRVVEAMFRHIPNMTLMSATNGEYGLELAQRYLPDAILLDIHLPGMDGYEVLKQLLVDSRTAHIPVIALSADAMPIDIMRGRKAGFHQYLTKPVRLELLRQTLLSILTTSQNN